MPCSPTTTCDLVYLVYDRFILETRYRQAWRPELAKTTRQSFGNPDDCSSGRTVIPAAGRLFQRPDDCLGGRTISPAYHSGGRILPRIVTPVPPDTSQGLFLKRKTANKANYAMTKRMNCRLN